MEKGGSRGTIRPGIETKKTRRYLDELGSASTEVAFAISKVFRDRAETEAGHFFWHRITNSPLGQELTPA